MFAVRADTIHKSALPSPLASMMSSVCAGDLRGFRSSPRGIRRDMFLDGGAQTMCRDALRAQSAHTISIDALRSPCRRSADDVQRRLALAVRAHDVHGNCESIMFSMANACRTVSEYFVFE
jgi:hypothetical protein